VVAVAVVGGINVDGFALVDRQPDDDHPALITAWSEGIGGKGANQAVAAARLGADVCLLGAVGDDADGERARRELTAAGVDCTAVRVVAGEPTGRVAGTVTTTGSKRTAALGGANLALPIDAVDAFASTIDAADLVICQLEPPPLVVRRVLEAAASASVPALLDIAPAQGPVRELAALARWVTGNRSEMRVASGVEVHDADGARAAAAVVRSTGPVIVGVTVGSAGQLVAWDAGEVWCAIDDETPIVDTAGAGDAFAATLAIALAEGIDPVTAAQLASRASTLSCRALGAQQGLPTREELGW
jgi:ribokinase